MWDDFVSTMAKCLTCVASVQRGGREEVKFEGEGRSLALRSPRTSDTSRSNLLVSCAHARVMTLATLTSPSLLSPPQRPLSLLAVVPSAPCFFFPYPPPPPPRSLCRGESPPSPLYAGHAGYQMLHEIVAVYDAREREDTHARARHSESLAPSLIERLLCRPVALCIYIYSVHNTFLMKMS